MNAELKTSAQPELRTSDFGLRTFLFLCLLLFTFAVATSSAAPSPAPAAAPATIEITPPLSVFVDRPDFGRDPFFPRSTRRGAGVSTNSVVQPVANFNDLVLKGISVNAERRLAIINNKTFEIGEEGDIRVNGQPVKVKCVEIRDKSVVIMVNEVSKELFLGSRF